MIVKEQRCLLAAGFYETDANEPIYDLFTFFTASVVFCENKALMFATILKTREVFFSMVRQFCICCGGQCLIKLSPLFFSVKLSCFYIRYSTRA